MRVSLKYAGGDAKLLIKFHWPNRRDCTNARVAYRINVQYNEYYHMQPLIHSSVMVTTPRHLATKMHYA